MGALGFFFDWSFNTCVLLGFAVALSSTAVAVKLLDDMDLRQTTTGNVSLGILIAQDVAVVPMILIIGALQSDEGMNYEGLIRLGVAIFIMAGLFYLLYKKPRVFKEAWAIFETRKAEAMKGQTAITGLAFCFTAAALAGVAGLSAAYGAFLAGLALGETMNRAKLEEQIKPIFDVMIMVFFLSIGLLIDLEFVMENIATVLSILFITMLLKTVANFYILRRLGMDKSEAAVTGAVLGQIGEFSFILAAMGMAANTIDSDGYKYVVAVISLSLLCTPLWIYLVGRFHLLDLLALPRRRRDDN
jgi:CPA2 family monovalent cation:H+ antiporter-2